MPIWSPRMRRAALELFKTNLIWIVLLAGAAAATGQPGALAWEAHLGGFLFGVFVGPHLFFRSSATALVEERRAG
jgi:membrane associated rhomboid family serine protease